MENTNLLIEECETMKMSATEYVNIYHGYNIDSDKYFIACYDICKGKKVIHSYDEFSTAGDCLEMYDIAVLSFKIVSNN